MIYFEAYHNEESYEKARKDAIALLKENVNDSYNLDGLDFVEIIGLLEQSKWIRAAPNETVKLRDEIDNWQRGYEDGYYEAQEDFKRGEFDES